MTSELRVLFVEDEENDYRLTLRELARSGLKPATQRVWTREAMRDALDRERWDLVLSDYAIPGFGGPQALQLLKETGKDIPLIVISGTIGEENAIQLLKAGANDFIAKDRMARLVPAIERAIAERDNRSARGRAEDDLKRSYTEQQRRQAELERSNSELAQFAYIAAHDLQEPLRMISTYLQLIERRVQGSLDPTTRGYLDFVSANAKRMLGMVAGVLDFALLGRDPAADEVFPADEAVRLAAQLLEAQIAVSGAAVEIPPLPTIRARRDQVVRLFQNLISNAIKFRGLEAPRIAISASPDGDFQRFAVADNGVGIEPRYRDDLFRLFSRLQAGGEGTGIGLASCRKIVEGHGGRIWIDSAPGRGTTFLFTLPAAADD